MPIKRRTFEDRAGLLQRMHDVHCFEVSEVMGLARELKKHLPRHGVDERSTFLPAPKTWLEWVTNGSTRYGVLLEEKADGKVTVTGAGSHGDGASWRTGQVLDLNYRPKMGARSIAAIESLAELKESDEELLALIAIINTPRVIGRRQHMPHRGLERRLTQALGVQGKFPLNAWTEIKLQVAPPKDMSGEGTTEAHLTGQRALHFCRSHLRIRLGRLEVVRSHWRGDASLGIRQSRYKLAA